MLTRAIFLIALIAVALPTPISSPPMALALGVLLGLTLKHPFPDESRKISKILLQVSVVGLGFAMDLGQVLRAGRSGFIYTLAGIAFALIIGIALGRALGVQQRTGYLISVGTAICGGSAIAAVAPVVDARDEEISVSIGTVFLLNAVGLLLFPVIGHALHLGESQFGLWAALAIHDTSSVVGAGAKYGALALAIATTVKLARALWIVPLTLGTAAVKHRAREGSASIQWPWFILFFLAAAALNSYLPQGRLAYSTLAQAARLGLTATLFLIGTGISRENLRQVGVRPLLHGIALWIVVASVSLWLIRQGWISI